MSIKTDHLFAIEVNIAMRTGARGDWAAGADRWVIHEVQDGPGEPWHLAVFETLEEAQEEVDKGFDHDVRITRFARNLDIARATEKPRGDKCKTCGGEGMVKSEKCTCGCSDATSGLGRYLHEHYCGYVCCPDCVVTKVPK